MIELILLFVLFQKDIMQKIGTLGGNNTDKCYINISDKAFRQLTDLNDDCALLLEHLDIFDLINVANMTNRLRVLAKYVFAKNFVNKTIAFYKTFASPDQMNTIDVDDMRIATYLLEIFCPVISNMEIYFEEISNNNTKTLLHSANQHCTSLKRLGLYKGILWMISKSHLATLKS